MPSFQAEQRTAAGIVVIDDEPQIRRLIRNALVETGYQVSDADTADAGDSVSIVLDPVASRYPLNS